MDVLRARTVAISAGNMGYGNDPPYSPCAASPEYPFPRDTLSKRRNPTYEGVRNSLKLLNLDAHHRGDAEWNPLGTIIRPGDTVVLKPNLVRDFRETQPGHGDCLITHGSVIRAVLDYVYIALGGRGRIVIADAPQNDADFDGIRRIAGLNEIQEFYRRRADLEVEVCDLRPACAHKIDGVIIDHVTLPGPTISLCGNQPLVPPALRCGVRYARAAPPSP